MTRLAPLLLSEDLVVWGGCGGDLCSDVRGDGARLVPDTRSGHGPICSSACSTPVCNLL